MFYREKKSISFLKWLIKSWYFRKFPVYFGNGHRWECRSGTDKTGHSQNGYLSFCLLITQDPALLQDKASSRTGLGIVLVSLSFFFSLLPPIFLCSQQIYWAGHNPFFFFLLFQWGLCSVICRHLTPTTSANFVPQILLILL